MKNRVQRRFLDRLKPSPASSEIQRTHNRKVHRDSMGGWGALAFVFFILVVCVSPNIFQRIPTVPVATAWPYGDIVTPYNIHVPDPEAEELQRRRLQTDHSKIFAVDIGMEDELERKTTALMGLLSQSAKSSSTADLKTIVRKRLGVDLRDTTLATLRSQSVTSRTLTDLSTIFHHLLDVRGVSADKSLLNSALRSNRALVLLPDSSGMTSVSLRQVLGYPGEAFDYAENAYLATFQISPEIKSAYADVVKQLLQPNITHNRSETDRRLQQALASVKVERILEPGAVVIRNGENVTAMAAAAIEQVDDREQHNDLLRILGAAVIVLMGMGFTALYAKRFNRDLFFTSRSVLMVSLPVVMAVSLGRAILNLGGGYLLGAFALPAGMVGILTVMLFDERFAIVLTTMTCVFFSTATGLHSPYVVIGLAGGFTAIASLRNLQERREVLYTGLHIALANCLVALAISLVLNPSRPELQAGLVAALVNGLVCYMLAVAALPIFENVFQITTDVLLLELTGGNHKLLKMMEEKAPGTLYHSMNVASLAEAAAEAVGAHYLLVRAGAYYHDIGKMLKPTYFTENQTTAEQKLVHTKLSPAMSTLIIKNHVKEGVELARSFRLPEKVVDFIPEHHGTTLIKYFYVQALKKAELDGSDELISEEEFRYPGPKPRSVETAILMLADSVEAISTSRFSGKNPDEMELRRAVHEVVTEKYEDRQLNNSPLTFRDLETIKEAFVRTLQNRFHQRIKYPTMPGKGGTAPSKNAAPRKGEDAQVPSTASGKVEKPTSVAPANEDVSGTARSN